MERQPDHRSSGNQPIHGLPGAQTTGGRGLRGGVEPQAARDACRCSDFRRREGGQADCLGLFQAAQGTRTLDLAVVGEQGGRTRHCRSCQRQHDRARAQKNTLQPHRRQHWVIPPKANSAFIAAMEDVLAVYTRPRDGDCPLVCLDETSKQLIAETRVPIPMKAGRPARFDHQYERNGTANLFMMFAPLEGWRNLSIHSKASLYEAFPAVEARRLVERFEWHYTPKHGSWLDLAESELGVLTSQCLDRRIPNKQILIEEIAAWEHDRNANHTKADWQFTTKNARIKLKHLYPAI